MIKNTIQTIERVVLLVIAVYAVGAVVNEVLHIAKHHVFELQDMLQLYIYAEVLAMVAAFFGTHTIPIRLVIFIAITAICRLMILQNKESDGMALIYESVAILFLSIAGILVSKIDTNIRKD
jgi:protein PsiE